MVLLLVYFHNAALLFKERKGWLEHVQWMMWVLTSNDQSIISDRWVC
jgi:hypothetical protein